MKFVGGFMPGGKVTGYLNKAKILLKLQLPSSNCLNVAALKIFLLLPLPERQAMVMWPS